MYVLWQPYGAKRRPCTATAPWRRRHRVWSADSDGTECGPVRGKLRSRGRFQDFGSCRTFPNLAPRCPMSGWPAGRVVLTQSSSYVFFLLKMCMGMGKPGILWVPWNFHGNGNKISHWMGMGWKWEWMSRNAGLCVYDYVRFRS